MLSDLRFAVRSLLRHRVFSLVAVLTLAVGIGAGGSIFSIVDYVLFRMSAFPRDVMLIGGRSEVAGMLPIRMDFQIQAYEKADVFASLERASPLTGNVVINGNPVASSWLGVSPGFLPLLGIKPALGRGFLTTENRDGANQVVVISDHFWHQQFGGAPDVLGRKLTVGDAVCTIVGVLRAGQVLPPYFVADVFRPLVYQVDPAKPWEPTLFVIAKLASGVTANHAEHVLQGLKVDIPPMLQPYLGRDQPVLTTVGDTTQFLRRDVYFLLIAAVAFLYAIACLNASNLMLVRMLGQRRELGIRLALGGGPWRVIRLLVIESVLLAAAAFAVGAMLANWIFPLLLRSAGMSFTQLRWGWTLDGRVLVVLGGLALLTSALVSVFPAVRVLRTDIYAGLKDGGAALGESRGLARLRGTIVVLQAAFAVLLLAGAGLMIRTFQNFQKVDLGFDPTRRVKVAVTYPPTFPKDWQARLARVEQIENELRRIPGVEAVGAGGDVLLPGYYVPVNEVIGPDGQEHKVAISGFASGFQEASGIRLAAGQWLDTKGDHVLINEALAREVFHHENPVGGFLRPKHTNSPVAKDWQGWLVMGVVHDIRSTFRDPARPIVYGPESWGADFGVFVLRLGRDYNEEFGGRIRRSLYAFDPQLVVYQLIPATQLRENQLWAERMADSVLKVLAGLALALTVVGVFSVLAYAVECRRPEFGVRMALGATPGHIMNLVLRRGVLLVVVGLALGVASEFALVRFMQAMLYGTAGQDLWVVVTVAALLTASAVAACLLPAWRASRVELARLLRAE